MTEMHYFEFLSTVEEILREVIRRCYPASWAEDHITYGLTDELARKLTSTQIRGLDRPFKTVWDARKLRGSSEQTLGDLAVVVRLRSWSGEEINGVGLLEAKRRDDHKAAFGSIRKRQLKTILLNAPSARLLLYDYSQITEFGDNLASSGVWHTLPDEPWLPAYRGVYPAVTPYSHSVTVPIGVALSTSDVTTGLYKYSLPFSVQLCGRYLRGLDLEYRDPAISKVEKFVNRSGGPRYLLLVGVSTGDGEAVLPDWLNENIYGPLQQS
jgi:hypothetical protein